MRTGSSWLGNVLRSLTTVLRARLLRSACMLALFGVALLASAAKAAPVPIATGPVTLGSISCPSSVQCTAVDGIGREVTFNPGSPGITSTVPLTPAPPGSTNSDWATSVACPSTTQCAAYFGFGQVVTFNPISSSVTASFALPPYSGGSIPIGSGVSNLGQIACPSVSQCVLVTGSDAFSFDPASPGVPPAVPLAIAHAFSIACPSASQCTAVGDTSEVTFDPASPGNQRAASVDSFALEGFTPYLVVVSCPSTTQCTAVDAFNNEITFNPLTPSASAGVPIETYNPYVTDHTRGLSCVATTACTAVEGSGRVISFDPTAPTPSPATIDPSGGPTAVSCVSAFLCVAVDQLGSEVTFNPAAPGSVIPYLIDSELAGPALFGPLSCPSVSQCTTMEYASGVPWIGMEGSFDPQAPAYAFPAVVYRDTTRKSSYGVRSLACPSVSQCTAVGGFGGAGQEMTFNPSAPGIPRPAPIYTATGYSHGAKGGVSCPSVSECIALAPSGGQEVTFDPASPIQQTHAQMDSAQSRFYGVSCPSVMQCTAFDFHSAITFNPLSPSHTVRTPVGPTRKVANFAWGGASCPSVTQCTVSEVGAEQTFNPRSTQPTASLLSGTIGITDLVCPTIHQCTALSGYPTVRGIVTFDPRSPGRPKLITIDPGSGSGPNLTSISCPSSSQCTAADDRGQEVSFVPQVTGGCVAPNLKGKTIKQIQIILGQVGCTLGKISTRHSKHVKRGRAISQSPAAHKRAKAGMVRIVLSSGR
jgi:hypothetical protein